MTRETWAADPKAPIDCFYVYPTISTDTTPQQRHDAGPGGDERRSCSSSRASHRSAARLRRCTARSRSRGLQPVSGHRRADPARSSKGVQYDDVRDAWQHYLKNDNQGRGVVLVGHSQGSFILEALIAQGDRRQADSEAAGRRIHPRRDVPHAEGQGRRRRSSSRFRCAASRGRSVASSTTRRSDRRAASRQHAVRHERRIRRCRDRARTR